MTPARRNLWLGSAFVLLAASALLSNTVLFRQTVQGNTALTRNIARQIGVWQVVDEQEASASEVRGLETRDIIKRTYSDGREYVELVVAYIAHSSRKSAHAQEACLRGAGALVGSLRPVSLERSPVRAMEISIDIQGHRDWVYYWYKMGNTYTADYLDASFKMFLRGLTGKQAGGTTLIRLLTPERPGEGQARIPARIEDFTANLLPELQKHLP